MSEEIENDGFDSMITGSAARNYKETEPKKVDSTEPASTEPASTSVDNDKTIVDDPVVSGGDKGDPVPGDDSEKKPAKKDEEDFNPFSSFEGDEGDSGEVPDHIKSISEKYQIEGARSMEDIYAAIDSRIEQAKNNPEFHDDDIRDYVNKINTIAKSGGDWRVIKDKQSRVSEIESRVASNEKVIGDLDSVFMTDNISAKKRFLANLYKAKLTEGQARILTEALEVKEDHEIISEANMEVAKMKEKLSGDNTSLKDEISSIQQETSEVAKASEAKAAAAKQRIESAISAYEDPDGIKGLTQRGRIAARQAFETDPTTVTLPSGVVESFFYEDGKFSPEKAINNLVALSQFETKKKFLVSEIKKREFQRLQNGSVSNRSDRPDGTGGGSTEDEWGGGFQFR